jgi:hypothetical protein
VQVSVNVLLSFSGPVLAEPAVAWVPDHAPEAVQDVASVLDHVSVELAQASTTAGSAEIVTVGAGSEPTTSTVADSVAVPPAPLQVIVYVLFAVKAPVLIEPAVSWAPDHAPEAVHDVASVLDHVSVELAPASTTVGLAEIATMGAGGEPTSTVTELVAVPPAPLQIIVYVLLAVKAPVLVEPAVAWAPDQAPDAVHDVASVLDHVSVELPPYATDMGLAVNVTTGGGE